MDLGQVQKTLIEMTPILCGSALFFIILTITLVLEKMNRNAMSQYEADEWFFSNINEKVYDAFFGKQDVFKACKAVGIDIREYIQQQKVTGQSVDFKNFVVYRIYSYVLLIIALIFLGLGMINDMDYTQMFIGIIFFLAGYCCIALPASKLKQDADFKLTSIELELPRFIDLFQTALQVGMPVNQALMETAKAVPGILSNEISQAIGMASVSSRSWIDVLEKMAETYNIDIFSDFVLNITSAEKKGIPIYEAVKQAGKDINDSYILSVKERCSKMNTQILIPVFLLKLMPIILFIIIPCMSAMDQFG